MVNKYAYDAFGKVLNQEEAIQNPFKYVGQFGVMDEENGLFYMRARYYDSEVGRFISKDPIGFAGGDINLYSYVQNNPTKYIDPFGLQSLVTDIANRTTTFDPRPLEPQGRPVTIETHVEIARGASPGAGDPFTTPNVTFINTIRNPSYGPPGAYIDTGDPRGRDIHGGGAGLTDPYAPRQGWRPTFGCTRGQNEDVQRLGDAIQEFQRRNPGVQIPYTRR
jgi:RHS repeat-associated protein